MNPILEPYVTDQLFVNARDFFIKEHVGNDILRYMVKENMLTKKHVNLLFYSKPLCWICQDNIPSVCETSFCAKCWKPACMWCFKEYIYNWCVECCEIDAKEWILHTVEKKRIKIESGETPHCSQSEASDDEL